MEDSTKKSGLNIGLIVIAILIIAAIAIAAVQMTKKKEATEQEQPSLAPTETTMMGNKKQMMGTTMMSYKNGTYSATGDYMSPGGAEQIDVKVTLKNNAITDATVISKATRPNSKQYQGMFILNFRPQVIGKNIDQITLTKVSGSSLTPKGFNDALEKIKGQAKS